MSTDESYTYHDVVLDIQGQIGVIKLNRPRALNSFGGNMQIEVLTALRVLDEHPTTVFTVLTGEGRFFSSGADVKAEASREERVFGSAAEKKVFYMSMFASAMETLRSLITHTKILVVALNGPAVGGGAAWFPAVADITVASETSYLQVPFSQLGLVPEYGCAVHFRQLIGPHRANDFLMFGRKISNQEMVDWGIVSTILPVKGFDKAVLAFLKDKLDVNDGRSMIEAKRLQNEPLRAERLLAVYEAADALAERFVINAPRDRFLQQSAKLRGKTG
ncbi:hypothetical protein PV10_08325 [Exophiala mesophila]|uniref:Enoyl-CoA hydratase n=1 Tax=Exophiala mesophila TaxID=212818 RepID=A0A0D1Z1L4_EXOME|nr:uncharacterized protein PV10_08325 [Exophiala mesophila]KIV88662.1 hypothetical protein PV10_08325 [Exophiala mesophila]